MWAAAYSLSHPYAPVTKTEGEGQRGWRSPSAQPPEGRASKLAIPCALPGNRPQSPRPLRTTDTTDVPPTTGHQRLSTRKLLAALCVRVGDAALLLILL